MDTLVLSPGYEPVETVCWQRAITLLCLEKVEVVSSYEDRKIRAVSHELQMPSVVRWLQYGLKRRVAVKFNRANVYFRDKGTCQYCEKRVSMAEFTYDHVVPRARGGVTEWTNVVVACFGCNQRKGGRTPAEAKMWPKRAPVRPDSLPLRPRLMWTKQMPESWAEWLVSYEYWTGKLDE